MLSLSSLQYVQLLSVFSLLFFGVPVWGLTGNASQFFGGSDNDVYLRWLSTPREFNYSSTYLTPVSTDDASQGAAIHWYPDADDGVLYVAVAVRAMGWVGFGLAETGGMRGSDMVIYESSNPDKLTDAHVLGELVNPLEDDCQDWTLLNTTSEGGFLIFEGKRNFVTGDSQDYEIIKDDESFLPAQKVIVAWGDTESRSFHAEKNAKGALRWFIDGDEITNFHQHMKEKSDGYFDFRVGNFTVPSNKTIYQSFCLSWSEIVSQGVPDTQETISLIGIEILADTGGSRLVHHANFYGTANPVEATPNRSCVEPESSYSSFYYSWTPGELPFTMPEKVGYTLGPKGKSQNFLLIVHYDNPKFEEGFVDNGGIRLHYTLEQQPMELGILALGDALGNLDGSLISDGYSSYEFTCPSTCSSLALGDEPVTAIREYFHMHASGVSAVQEHYRDGKELRKSEVNFWDFNQTGLFSPRQRPFEVMPGDSFRTTCYFRSDGNLRFGKASEDEMCHGYITYYPAKKLFDSDIPWACVYEIPFLLACSPEMQMKSGISDERSLLSERSFGDPSGQCFNNVTTPGGENSSSLRISVTVASILSFIAVLFFH